MHSVDTDSLMLIGSMHVKELLLCLTTIAEVPLCRPRGISFRGSYIPGLMLSRGVLQSHVSRRVWVGALAASCAKRPFEAALVGHWNGWGRQR